MHPCSLPKTGDDYGQFGVSSPCGNELSATGVGMLQCNFEMMDSRAAVGALPIAHKYLALLIP
jgi:hypothetical protein